MQACESLGPTIFNFFVSRYAEIILCGRHKIISCALQLYIGRISTTLCMVRFKSQLHRGEHTLTFGICTPPPKNVRQLISEYVDCKKGTFFFQANKLLIAKFPRPSSHTSNTVDKLNKFKLPGLVNVFTIGAAIGTLVVLLLLPLSLAMDDNEFDHGGGGGDGGSPAAAATAAVAAMDNNWW